MSGQCGGWAYQPCNRPAMWCVLVEYANKTWEAWHVCTEHCAIALGPTDDWTQRPRNRLVVPYPPGGIIAWPAP